MAYDRTKSNKCAGSLPKKYGGIMDFWDFWIWIAVAIIWGILLLAYLLI